MKNVFFEIVTRSSKWTDPCRSIELCRMFLAQALHSTDKSTPSENWKKKNVRWFSLFCGECFNLHGSTKPRVCGEN